MEIIYWSMALSMFLSSFYKNPDINLLWVLLLIIIGLPLLSSICPLSEILEVNDSYVTLKKHYPFKRKRIIQDVMPLEKIKKIYVRKYQTVINYKCPHVSIKITSLDDTIIETKLDFKFEDMKIFINNLKDKISSNNVKIKVQAGILNSCK
ncbi:MAG: hypothetical protein KAU14_02175 [Thermoplasmata archaeon]|nr:hypothetical protein [Thermoplasmata archaeon]